MSRIRSIHPGLWTDEAFVCLSPLARLLFIGTWNECDDKGIFPWSPLKLKMRVLPADSVDATELLTEIEGAGLVCQYQFGDRSFGAVKNFALYQRPKKPNDIHPASAEILRFAGMNSELAEQYARPLPNQFPTSGENSPQRKEGGGNRSSVADATGADAPPISASDVTKAVWDSGKSILKAAGIDDRQAGSIIGRLRKSYSDSQVLVVLSRCQVVQPSDPVEWLTKALQQEAKNGRLSERSADAFASLRGARPNAALDMVIQSERELAAEAERENPWSDRPLRAALPPH